MVELLLLLAGAPAQAFEPGMIGLWDLRNGDVLAITRTDHANLFDIPSKQFYVWRDLYTPSDGGILGADLVADHLQLIPTYPPSGSPQLHITLPRDSTEVPYGPKGDARPDAILRVDITSRDGSRRVQGFNWTVGDYVKRTPLASGRALRSGTLDDIRFEGTYASGKAVTITFTSFKVHDAYGTFTGKLTWKETPYNIKGEEDGTHLHWKSYDPATDEPTGEGFVEWAPTKDAVPSFEDKWGPTDWIYLQGTVKGSTINDFLAQKKA